MLHALIGIAVVLLIVGVAVWTSRTKPSQGGGSNEDSARRYGSGWRG